MIGAAIPEAMIVGNQITGFLKMFLNCNIDVPKAIDKTMPSELSFLDCKAKPSICIEVPTTAAPPAIPRDEVGSNEAGFNPNCR